MNNDNDDEMYDEMYDDDEFDINNQKPPPFPSHYRIDDQYFKMPSIPRVRQYRSDKEYIVITFDTHEIFRGTFDTWDGIDEINEEYYTTYYHMQIESTVIHLAIIILHVIIKNICLMTVIIIMKFTYLYVKSSVMQTLQENKWKNVLSIKYLKG
jgi:hypothetical protein